VHYGFLFTVLKKLMKPLTASLTVFILSGEFVENLQHALLPAFLQHLHPILQECAMNLDLLSTDEREYFNACTAISS